MKIVFREKGLQGPIFDRICSNLVDEIPVFQVHFESYKDASVIAPIVLIDNASSGVHFHDIRGISISFANYIPFREGVSKTVHMMICFPLQTPSDKTIMAGKLYSHKLR